MAHKNTGVKERIRNYVKHCLADACRDFANLQYDLSAADTSPGRMRHSVNRQNRAELEQLAEDDIKRIRKISADLKQVK